MGSQFYEVRVSDDAAIGRMKRSGLDQGIPADKIGVGMRIGSTPTTWTLDTCKRVMTRARDELGVRNCYLWDQSDPQAAQWAKAMREIVGRG